MTDGRLGVVVARNPEWLPLVRFLSWEIERQILFDISHDMRILHHEVQTLLEDEATNGHR